MSGLVGTSAMQWERVERIGARKLRIAGVLGFAGLTALAAQVSVALQPYGIPITMQTLPVMLCALTLGGRLGMASMLVYVLLGLVGLPIFAHGAGGLSHVWGASGGYLLGFVVAQPIISAISRVRIGTRGGPLAVCVAVLAGHAVVFVLGVTWLKLWGDAALSEQISWAGAWFWGCAVFLPGTFAKAGIAAVLGPGLVGLGRRLGC
ncbi:MAG: biotin transporter BioY [Planctomycetes bacterium]|nr:biotin transporter BioY [Planctomycetota bacterium]